MVRKYVRKPVVGKKYFYATLGFDLEVEVVEIVSAKRSKADIKCKVKITAILNEEEVLEKNLGTATLVPNTKKMIQDGFVFELHLRQLRQL